MREPIGGWHGLGEERAGEERAGGERGCEKGRQSVAHRAFPWLDGGSHSIVRTLIRVKFAALAGPPRIG